MKNKLCAGLLAGSMILSSSVMAFAASGDVTSESKYIATGPYTEISGATITSDAIIEGNGEVDPGVLNINLPTEVSLILNPYQIGGKNQIESAAIPFKNFGNVGLDVLLKGITTSSTSMSLIDRNAYDTVDAQLKDMAGYSDSKYGTIYLQPYVVSSGLTENDAYVVTGDNLAIKGDPVTSSSLLFSDEPTFQQQLGLTTSGESAIISTSPVSVGKLAVTPNLVSDDGVTVITSDSALLSESVMFLKFDGKLNPRADWTENDKIEAKMVFKLKPASVTTAESLFYK